ncbi:MAG: 2-phospho-L-lactate transferase [Pseudomonadota bacterium]|nr:2-phospho-L-lactate transferase [Pseudomonadota bacterium]
MTGRIVVLTGGVGGAKLALGMCAAAPAGSVTAIVNTGDDFSHFGLFVSPDIDTLLYTLSGQANAEQGWGRENETASFMTALRSLGAEDWFNLGDGDLALHVLRTHLRGLGVSLSEITKRFARAWRLEAEILPMTDDPVSTQLQTDDGVLAFQHYFVKRRCAPRVRDVRYCGSGEARPAPGLLEALRDADAIIIAPSNPYLSIGPILAIPEIREALLTASAPRVAVSPIIGGESVKGPTSKLMRELGVAVDNQSIADFYGGLIDGLVIDERDAAPAGDVSVRKTNILMWTTDDKRRVAEAALAFADELRAP